MSDSVVGRYWCYECRRVVNGVDEVMPKCPRCDSSFVEDMESRRGSASRTDGSRRSVSFWAPILFGMLADSSRQSRGQRDEEEGEDDTDLDREFEELVRRRRRSSAILRVLHSLYFVEGHEFDEFAAEGEGEGEGDNDDGESVILIDSANQAIIVQGSSRGERNRGGDDSDISFSDYFLGPSLDLLIQRFAENDLNRYGTPPAKQEAVDALPTVNVDEPLSCSVCLEDMEVGTEAKEMPCKHRFHTQCILPWLELHCSCPLCRFQLPSDESKIPSRSRDENGAEDSNRLNAGNGTGIDPFSVDGDGDASWPSWFDEDES